MADLILLVVLAVIVGAAVRYLYKAKKHSTGCAGCDGEKNGGCSGCSGCAMKNADK